MKHTVKNETTRPKAVKVRGGTVDVLPGASEEIDISGDAHYLDRLRQVGLIVTAKRGRPRKETDE